MLIDFTDFKAMLGLLAGFIGLVAYVVYFVSIIRGKSKPNRTTWGIWAFMGLILALSYHFSGAGNTIWLPYMEFVGPFLVALLAIKYGEGGLEDKTDLWCMAGAAFSIVLWVIFDSPEIALFTNLAIDTFAIIPTIKKSYLRPEGEDFSGWFGTAIADTVNMFALEKFTFAVVIYPVYMLVSDYIIISILYVRKRMYIKNWDFLVRHK